MSMHLITGYKGEKHVTSADQGSYNAALWGNDEFVLERGNQFSYEIISNTKVKILDGDLMCQGRHARVEDYEEMLIDNGDQGLNRHDLIVAEYTKQSGSGIEAMTLKVIKGTPAASAVDPAVTTGSILGGDLIHQMPLYRVKLENINLVAVEKLFETVETMETMKAAIVDETTAATQAITTSAQQQVDAIATNAQQQIDDLVANTNTGVTENADAIDDIVDGTTKVGNTDRLDGHDSTYFAQQSDMDDVVDYIQSIHYSAGVVGNSHKLGGHDSSYFAKKSVVTAMGSDINQLNYNLNSLASGTVKAGNAEKLDGHDSTYFATASALNAKLNASAYTANDVFSKVKSKDGSGSGLDADLLDGHQASYFATAASVSGVALPAGIIVMWSGATSAIPAGWALCNGQNGTPDLRNRFIVGAGSSYNVGNKGGANTVTLSTGQIPSHRHGAGGLYASTAGNHNHSGSTSTAGAHTHAYTALNDSNVGQNVGQGTGHIYPDSTPTTQSAGAHAHSLSINNAGNHSHSVGGNTGYIGGGAAHENRPLYYALAYIMKL